MTSHSSNGKEHVTETPDVSHIKNVDVTYEHSDISIGGVLKFIIGLTVMAVVVNVLMWVMFKALDAQEAKNDPPPRPMALSETERLPPEPRLQAAKGYSVEGQNLELKEPEAELKVVQQKWKDVLEKGPVDERGQHYGMPIEEAKKKIVEQGLPVRRDGETGGRGDREKQ
ncbi:MAG TPA: hypothetical protein VGJ55_13145 [Pyrinomonadaceae bacterium]|jgi:hypothetical protein